jgi:hypothetical protein
MVVVKCLLNCVWFRTAEQVANDAALSSSTPMGPRALELGLALLVLAEVHNLAMANYEGKHHAAGPCLLYARFANTLRGLLNCYPAGALTENSQT